jgi:hypothetical protein
MLTVESVFENTFIYEGSAPSEYEGVQSLELSKHRMRVKTIGLH